MTRVRTVEIYVEPDAQSKSGYKFWMEEGGSKTRTLVFDKTVDKMKKEEDYRVEFNLNNCTKADLRFSEIATEVLWAKEISKPSDPCPDQKCYLGGIFYVDPATQIKAAKLTVINMDMDRLLFAFALNFVRKGEVEGPNTKYICYDPIGENRNGGVNAS